MHFYSSFRHSFNRVTSRIYLLLSLRHILTFHAFSVKRLTLFSTRYFASEIKCPIFKCRLNELDRLSEIHNDVSQEPTTGSPAGTKRPNFCEFEEPYIAEVEEVFNKTVTKSFQVACSELEGSLGTRNKRDMCEVFRYDFFCTF